MAIIKFARAIEKPMEGVILPAKTYLLEVTEVKDGLTRAKDKQFIRVIFKVVQDGEFFGVKLNQGYSIQDDLGNQRFADMYKAAIGPTSLDVPVTEMDTAKLEGKKLYATVRVETREIIDAAGEKVERVYNKVIDKNGYAPYEAGAPAAATKPEAAAPAATPAAPAMAAAPATAAATDNWD